MLATFVEFMRVLANSTYRVMFTMTSVMIFWIFLSWSLGLVPAFGAGFARQEDVRSIQVSMLETAIIEARIRYCSAPNGTPSKTFFLQDVNSKVSDYRKMTGVNYQLPTCEELVFASN